MAPRTLLLVLHNHQPQGNFGEVFEQGVRDSYAPLIEMLLEFPHVKCALHYSGPLLEWMEVHSRTLFPKLATLVERGQVELLGGGFYEPMLAVLPERDALGQLRMMSTYLETHFRQRPQGLWLAERVWEPGLPALFAQAGLSYTLLDDSHFRAAGLTGPLSGYYLTEKAGDIAAIFPIDKDLRYAIPFHPANEVMDLLRSLPEGVYTYGDDGEKFGMWPGTKSWVWEQGWLRSFFTLLTEHRNEIATQTPSQVLRQQAAAGRVYLPAASYEEMGEWTLFPDAARRYTELRHNLESRQLLDAAKPFLRGGIWQNFFAKYEEANLMHKKMVYVSRKLANLESSGEAARRGLNLAEAKRELYRGQCNCAYWHGLFGGLYLGYLRHAVYKHLITAETLAEPDKPRRVVRVDYDGDRADELILEGPTLAVYIKPNRGGSISELDDRVRAVNLLNVLSRRREPYHDELAALASAGHEAHGGGAARSIHDMSTAKEAGLERLLVPDRHLRFGFIDHFLPPGTSLADVMQGTYTELGAFVDGAYAVREAGAHAVMLERTAALASRNPGKPDKNDKAGDVTVTKQFDLLGNCLRVGYDISSTAPLDALFAPEFSLFLDTAEERGAEPRTLDPMDKLRIRHDWLSLDVEIRLSSSAPIWRFPLQTASRSEAGFERTYQGSVFLPHWRLKLQPGTHFRAVIDIELTHA